MAKFDYDRLEALIKESGKTKTHLCKVMGKSRYYLRDARKVGTNISGRELELLAGELGVSPEYLLGKTEKKTPGAPEKKARREIDGIYEALNGQGRTALCRYGRYLTEQEEFRAQAPEEPEIEYIRHYLSSAAAGYAAPIEGEDYELVPRDKDVPYGADFCLDISGDSMEPYIKDGQRVYVQQNTSMKEFDVGIFFVDGDMYCKQWCEGYDGSLYLLSANPLRRDANITIHRDGGRVCVCFGKVLLPHRLPQPSYV